MINKCAVVYAHAQKLHKQPGKPQFLMKMLNHMVEPGHHLTREEETYFSEKPPTLYHFISLLPQTMYQLTIVSLIAIRRNFQRKMTQALITSSIRGPKPCSERKERGSSPSLRRNINALVSARKVSSMFLSHWVLAGQLRVASMLSPMNMVRTTELPQLLSSLLLFLWLPVLPPFHFVPDSARGLRRI